MTGCMQGLRGGVGPEVFDGIPTYRNRRGGVYGSEEEEQIAFFEWVAMLEGRYPELESMYHVPNGGKRSKAAGGRLKASGMRAGVPDLCLPCASGGYIGLYIELKVDDNKPTQDQKIWLRRLCTQGHYSCVCYGWECAAAVTKAYLCGEIQK